MENHKDLHLMYKNLGETPNETILRWKKENPGWEDKTMTYAGRLDPMAEGVLLVLSGDALQIKEQYLHLPKTYEFEILWGFETDTYDILGLLDTSSFSTDPSKDTDIFLLKTPYRSSTPFADESSRSCEASLLTSHSLRRASLVPSQDTVSTSLSTGKFEQLYPPYSSKPVSGKPLFKWAREGRLSQIEIPKHEVEVFGAEYLGRRELAGSELLRIIEERVGLVTGDFRQEEILKKWRDVLNEKDSETFVLDKIKLSVSSGFYIRQFVEDLGKKFGVGATTFHIKRTKLGEFEINS